MLAKIKERFSDQMFDTIIHVNVKLKEAVLIGKTVAHYDKYSRGFKDYFSLARELISSESDRSRPTTFPSRLREVSSPIAPAPRPAMAEENFRSPSQATERRDTAHTTFSLAASQAQSVYLTGSFNDWSLDESCRMKKENDRWVIRLPLKPGLHRYRFIVDGRWQEDPGNPRQEKNPFGDPNSLIEVK